MAIQDQVMLALTIWRENRGGGLSGMQSVANVIVNRAARHKTDVYTECARPLQFSSITAKGDAELTLWPSETDPQWQAALSIAAQASAGALEDITGGADLYYAPAGQPWTKHFTLPNGSTVLFPDKWDMNAVQYSCTIAHQVFFRSV
jgi:spore germination cell wall hydrolase CwlJ-like protein